MVDSSLGLSACVMPWTVEAKLPSRIPLRQPFPLSVSIHYPCREPFPKADNHVSTCHVLVELPAGLALAADNAMKPVGDGFLQPGDHKQVCWTLTRTGPVDGQVNIRVRGIVSNNDPYLYAADVLGIRCTFALQVDAGTGAWTSQLSAPCSEPSHQRAASYRILGSM